jgi:lipopolysaccharide/colanic/teichoic acid biosynthesis glycosyltransferase
VSARTRFTVRILDVVGAVCALALSLPLWPVIALAVRLESPGPMFYRARRLGRDEQVFEMLKFRSMRAGTGLAVTVSGDSRVTRTGRLLRATKLDELPQLINVLRGEMSLVGPRPEDPCYLNDYPGELRDMFRYKPGMTSPASLAYRHEEAVLAAVTGDPERFYIEEVLPAKAAMDLDYCRSRTARSDLRLLLTTARTLARGPHAGQETPDPPKITT